MSEVFISYSSKNKKYADTMCYHLEEGGIKCWYAPRNIPVGGVWAESITDAISKCKVFVMILSKKSILSNQVFKEINLAKELGKEIVVFNISRIKIPNDILMILKDGCWLDSMNKMMFSSIDELYRVIAKILDREYRKVKKNSAVLAGLSRLVHNVKVFFHGAVYLLKQLLFSYLYKLKDYSFHWLFLFMIAIILIVMGKFIFDSLHTRIVYGIWNS